MFRFILELAKEEHDRFVEYNTNPIIMISGAIGTIHQASNEACSAADFGYDAILLTLVAFPDASNQEMLTHCRAIAQNIPVIGFYLQPAIWGYLLDVNF